MSAFTVRRVKAGLPPQRGAAVLVVLLLVMLIGLSFLLSATPEGTGQLSRQETTQASLAVAREALLGYARTYRDTHPGKAFGYLPCPDTDNDGSADTCVKDKSALGRLPWKTLGLEPLRDAAASCLWYAVAGSLNSNNKTNGLSNWDSLPQFSIQNPQGVLLANADTHNGAVAVVFAPGPTLAANGPRAASASECGGGVADAYLENGTGFANALNATAQDPRGANAPDPGVQTVRQGRVGDTANNDQLVWITSADIFDAAVVPRSDFVAAINTLLQRTATCLKTTPPPLAPSTAAADAQGLDQRPPASLATCVDASGSDVEGYFAQFRDQLWYYQCVSGVCLTQGSTNCVGALYFSGQRAAGEDRRSRTARNLPANYFAATGIARDMFTIGVPIGTILAPLSLYVSGSTADIPICISN